MRNENIEDIYTLSPIQQGILFHSLYAPESSTYFEQFNWTFQSELDVSAFERAWQQVIARHPILRTSFFWEDLDEPLQLVHRRVKLPYEQLDWHALPPDEQQAQLQAYLRAERRRGFDLAEPPLMRVTTIQFGPQEHQVVWNYHHLLLDGWSVALLLEEFMACYEVYRQGQEPRLERRRPYRDYVGWVRRWDADAAEDFWRRTLRGFSEPTSLRVDLAPGSLPSQAEDYALQKLRLSPETLEALQAAARAQRVTFNTLVQGAWALLLSRYSGTDDVMFGVTVSGRPPDLAGSEGMIGLFINTLPVRVQVPPHEALSAWLQGLQAQQVELRQYECSPLIEVQGWSSVPRGLPLFESIVVFENYPVDTFGRIPDLNVFQKTNYPLTLMAEPGAGLMLRLGYDARRFDADTVARILSHLRTILEGIAANSQQRLADITLLTSDEQRAVLAGWNPAPATYSQDTCLHERFEAQAARTPEAVALVFDRRPPTTENQEPRTKNQEPRTDGDATRNTQHATRNSFLNSQFSYMTYRELNERANQLAHALRRQGVGPEVPVGVYMERSLELVVALLGTLKAGGAYLPLDPAYPHERIQYMLHDAQIPVLLTTKEIGDWRLEIDAAAQSPISNLQSLAMMYLDTDWETIAQEPTTNLDTGVVPDNLAYVIYTSGSTGKPKGVQVTHANVGRLFAATQDWFHFDEHDVWTLFHSYAFDFSVWELWGALLYGARLVVVPYLVSRAPDQFYDLLRSQRVTVLNQTPSAFRQLIHLEELRGATADLALRLIIFGGEALDPQSLRPWFARHGDQCPQLVNMYGITETTVHVTYRPLALADLDGPARSVIGGPIPDLRFYLLDPLGRPVAPGIPGEIYVGGDGVARGYLNRPELTAERFIPNPFYGRLEIRDWRLSEAQSPISNLQSPISDRLYKTGDLARYLPDGEIEYLGRIDQQVKIRGFRIELGEIAAVLGQHPDVREAVVLAREDVPGDRRLVAYVVSGDWRLEIGDSGADNLQSPISNLPQDLRTFLKDRLPDYMVPSAFVLLDELPLTANGKLDRRALPAPDSDRPDLANDFTAPRTPEETTVARIWAEVLNLERVGVDDNFFGLGGHSLLATQVLSRLREALQVELPLRSLFEAPTVAGLAQRIMTARRETLEQQAPPLVPVARNPDAGRGAGALPLSFAQLRLWFLYQLEPESPAYNIPIALLLQGPLHVEALEHSLNTIIERHEALRTTFSSPAGRPVQVIGPPFTVHLAVEDLQAMPRPEQRRRLNASAQQPFDLERGPLLRTLLLQRAPEEHVLLLTLHHIIGDAWSTGVLVQEASRLYAAFVNGQPATLPELPIQYADFAVWQRQWLEDASDGDESPLQAQLAYWKQQLAGAHEGEGPPLLELPTDRPRPPIQTFRGKTRYIELPPELVWELTALSRREGTTLFMTMLAAFKVLLHHYSGQDDIVVGSPIAGRTRVETEGLIGCFVNTLALRTRMAGNPSFRDLLLRVREVCLGAYAHQDLPFEKLAEELQLERDLSRNPLFQVMFVLQNAPMPSPELAGLTLYQLPIESETARLDLTLSVEQAPEGLIAMCEYNVDLFDDATIERLLGHFRALLDGIITNPDSRVSALPLLTEAERRQLLVEWNATSADYPAGVCIHHLFEAQAARTPDAVAIADNRPPTADHRPPVLNSQFSILNSQFSYMTYAEINRRANRLAHHLRTLGVGPGAPVGLCMERSVELIVGMLGVLKAGGAYLPLDPAYPTERLRYMVEDAQVSVVLTSKEIGDWRLEIDAPQSPISNLQSPTVIDLDADWPTIARQPETNPDSRVTADNLAYVIYTSGATGKPKGVLVPHRALVNHSHAIVDQYRLGPADRVLQFASPSFDVAAEELFPSWLSGAVVILRPDHLLASLDDFEQYLAQERLTVVNLPTPYWHAWVGELARSGALLPPDLRLVVIGSEQALPDRLALWQQVVGDRVAWHNAYGPSEATITATIYKPAPGDPPGVSAVPIGRPIANTQTYILDRNLMPVPVGVPGQLYIGGAGLAWGYVGQPGLTAERFVPNPFGQERLEIGDWRLSSAQSPISNLQSPISTRLYATGDLARYRPDGTIEFLGRTDEQVKVRGFRIEPGEIETALGQHPSVREAVVLAREDTPGHRRLVAYIVAGDWRIEIGDSAFDNLQSPISNLPQILREFLRDRLPDYMVPSAFVLLEALPLNPSGKIERRALPAPSGPEQETESAAPATRAEELLAGIWAEVLGIERVGVHDNFFDLGGDSILSIQIIARARQAGLRLDPKLLFRYQTIADLAAVAGVAPLAHAEQGLVTGPLPLTPIQHWFFEQELPAPYHWNQSVLLEVGAALDPAQLEHAIGRLLIHHDALRLRFAHDGAGWRQEHAADEPHPVCSFLDLAALPEREHAATIAAAAAEAQASLNLAEGPIVRAIFFARGAGAPGRLLLVVHHLAVDGFSWRILLADLELLCRQLLQGAAHPSAQARLEIGDWGLSASSNLQSPISNLQLPAKTTSFKRWAERLADYGRSEAIREELDFWLAVPRVAGARLPVDHRAGANTEASARTLTVALDADATRALLEQVPRAYHTQINEVLLAALVEAFAEWTSERALLLDLEGHGREALFDDVDLSRTVGWFTTIFPVELDLRAAHGPGAMLKAAKEQLRAIPGRGIGYGVLRYLSQDAEVARRLRDRPQPEVLFNYLGQLDQARPDAALFGMASEPRGPEHSLLGPRSHQLEINGFIAGGMLRLEWSYSENLHRHDTIERLAQAFLAALRDLIAHCLAPDAGGYSSSDFAPFGWGQDDLDSILGGIRQTLGEVEDVPEER